MGVWIEITRLLLLQKVQTVAPFVGVWIEILMIVFFYEYPMVAPFVGVWIEIKSHLLKKCKGEMSLPLWECGLKYMKIWQSR